MGKPSTRLPSFCLNRIATRVRVRSPPVDPKPDSTDVETPPPSCNGEKKEQEKEKEKEKEVESVGRKVMVVVDWSQEAKTALQWALSHSLQSTDTITLIDIIKPCKNGGEQPRKDGDRDPKEYQLLNAMKSICQSKRPEQSLATCVRSMSRSLWWKERSEDRPSWKRQESKGPPSSSWAKRRGRSLGDCY
ncbi:uncharacterized protein [Typha angustifolia]|uniref:uncharacterized protein isoform X2 n=1 Tax=Typha angustifolia TaxID=59011 RepID=UPI003C2C1562